MKIQSHLIYIMIFTVQLLILHRVAHEPFRRKGLEYNIDISRRTSFLCLCFFMYMRIVIELSFFSSLSNIYGEANLHFLSSYKEILSSFDPTALGVIILNILILVPLGIMLPLSFSIFRKFKWTLTAAVIMTFSIEIMQLITGRGAFSIDDIFNNIIGAIIGYGLVMMIITLLEGGQDKYKRSVVYLSPLIVVIVSSVVVVGVYNSKELGNFYIADSDRVNMKNVDLILSTKIENQSNISEVPIYKAETYNKDSGEAFFIDFLKNKNINKEIEVRVDSDNDMAIYGSRNEASYNMWFYFEGGNYSFTDHSSLDEGIEEKDADEETLLKHLKEFGITLPDSAVFCNEDYVSELGIFDWDVENYVDGDYITNGHLSVIYYNDDSIKYIDNSITRYKRVRDVSIISKEEAYERFKKGNFNLYDLVNIKKMEIKDIRLSYSSDSKGFYQPIYSFIVMVDGKGVDISIPAL